MATVIRYNANYGYDDGYEYGGCYIVQQQVHDAVWLAPAAGSGLQLIPASPVIGMIAAAPVF